MMDKSKPAKDKTLREEYAGLAMQGLITNQKTSEALAKISVEKDDASFVDKSIAKLSIDMADALIEALENSDG